VANTFIKAGQIVSAASMLLQRELVLANLVMRQADSDFRGALNDTVTLRFPAVLASRTRVLRSTTALVADDLTETSVPITLDTHIYTLLNVTDEQLTLDIFDFSAQVLAPQMRAAAEGLDGAVATELAATTADAATINIAAAATKEAVLDYLVDASIALNVRNVPRNERVLVVGANMEARIIKALGARETSSGDSALADATIARFAGFRIVGSNAVGVDTGYAFHRSAIALGMVAPALPEGATMKARVAHEGIAMRYLRDYNPTNSTGPVDRSLVDLFAGVTPIEEGGTPKNKRLVKLALTA